MCLNKLLLASQSPRRCELLRRIGLSFCTDIPGVDESCNLPAPEAVCYLSRVKARAVAKRRPGFYVLSADTLVSFRGRSLGKPTDRKDAAGMLRMLSGQTHQVYTGVSVVTPEGSCLTDYDCTDVTFSVLSEEEILSYIESGEPMDKAGAYALQGRAGMWVEHIDGSDSSVIGLPLYLVRKMLLQAGYDFCGES